ncbi:hypothetical protein F5146DRAFT_995662 [Armillaria mellea]|nr:hypothetical protein F5146DRAFT_995662 [Armillaria mellea]
METDAVLMAEDSNSDIYNNDMPMETTPSFEPEPHTPELEELQQSQCNHMIPRHFQDYLPTQTFFAPLQQYASLQPQSSTPASSISSKDLSPSPTPEPRPFIPSESNAFGLYYLYKMLPSVDPDDALTIADLYDAFTYSLPPSTLKQCSPLSDGWICDHITLQLPQSGVHHALEEAAPSLDIPNVWHHSLLDIVCSAFQDASSLHFHLKGFKEHWLWPDGCMEHVYSEVYILDVFLEMEDQITPKPGCSLETVIAPMMVYSDLTCLANFGTATLWPAYVGFGLMSKYA